MTPLVLIALLALAAALLYSGRAFLSWALPVALALAWWWMRGGAPILFWLVAALFVACLAVFGVPSLRRRSVTQHVMRLMAPMFPPMSSTERVALEAGTVWWDAELFSGRPDWRKLLEFRRPGLTRREKSFLEHEVEEVCRMVDSEEVDRRGDLSAETWAYLKAKGFMGMIIPEAYGGLGFSAEANSAVVTKVSSRNVTLAVTVMVPNSLGPAELLLHYGTKEQKEHYLPRLASGEEVPAFALTEPHAGSDASAMTSTGVICKGTWEGEEVLGIRLNWNKRYITLAPVATLLGLAFKLHDPDRLIGDREDLGITCALIPTDLPGVETGRRHDPLGIKFLNGPTTGRDVFIPFEQVIGGQGMAGQGWRMLMDCLSAGRSISLPALACGSAQVATRALSAYTLIREQFGLPIAKFEGIEDPLGRIAGMTWAMNATRRMTAGAVASGQKPSVISAIVKAYLTEAMRGVVNDGMDVQGGAGISRGPRNVLARMYQAVPIGITVEGANILTRTLIVYGQGAIRCHPYAFKEMEAARAGDLEAFDKAFFGHVGFVVSNVARSKLLAWTGGALARSPVTGAAAPYYKKLSRAAAAFAVVSDTAMATLGGGLKRKERLTGRLADALAWMYIASACLKRFSEEGERRSDVPFLRWSCDLALHHVQEALVGFMQNMPNRPVAWLLRLATFPLGRPFSPPSDRETSRLAHAMLEDDDLRERLTPDVFVPENEEFGLGMLDLGRRRVLDAAAARHKLKEAVRAGALPRQPEPELVDEAVQQGVLSADEGALVRRALEAQDCLVQVDAFDDAAYEARCGA